MRNQKGFGVVLMVFGVFVMVVVFIAAASVHFQSLYGQIVIQQRAVAGQIAMEDFAVMAQRAREVFVNTAGACDANTELDGAYQLCWPRAVGTQHCVPHPLGNTNAAVPRWICRTPGGAPTGVPGQDGVMDVVLQTQASAYTVAQWFQDQFYDWRQKSELGLDLLVTELRGWVFAQTSESVHLPALGGAPNVNFAGVVNCGAYVAADAPYCKRCPPLGAANVGQCFRIRICVRPTACNVADNNDWVVQKIAILNR